MAHHWSIVMNSNDFVCPSCGHELVSRTELRVSGLFCSHCEWAVVTTYIPEILKDCTKYKIWVESADFENVSQLRVVAKLCGINLLAARDLLKSQERFLVAEGFAQEVLTSQADLLTAKVRISIEPPFPW